MKPTLSIVRLIRGSGEIVEEIVSKERSLFAMKNSIIGFKIFILFCVDF